jgi:hypothetical protein
LAWVGSVQAFDGGYRLNGEIIMLYYSHFVIASSVTTFKFVTDLQLLYLDAVDHFLNYNSFDRGPRHHSARDHDLADQALPDPTLLDLEAIELEPADLKPLDQESIDHLPASLPVPANQDHLAAAVMAVMPEPRLALLEGGKSDAVDGQTKEGEWKPVQSARVDAGTGEIADEENGQAQDGRQESAWIGKTAATVVVVAAGAALFEAALLPGLALGVAAIAAPKVVSRLAGAFRPIFKSTVRATYRLAKAPKAAFAGAQQQINGIIAEARAEDAHHFGMQAAEELRAAA